MSELEEAVAARLRRALSIPVYTTPPIEVPKRVDRIMLTEEPMRYSIEAYNNAKFGSGSTTHHWITKSDGRVLCSRCGQQYEGGIHNDETCPEAPK